MISYEQGTLYFYFPVDPTNYIAGYDYKYFLILLYLPVLKSRHINLINSEKELFIEIEGHTD